MLLVEYHVLDNLKVINEGTSSNPKTRLRGKFQKCDETNNNGRSYPRKILESQIKEIQSKIDERSLVGALDHPTNDAIHLSQASHLINKLWIESNGDVMGEAEILSTPNGKIVQALLNDNVKIGISSRGVGTLSESEKGKVVNDDFKLITFDLVSDPSTKGAYPELTESVKLNSQKAQKIVSECKKERVLMTLLKQKIDEALSEGYVKARNKAKKRDWEANSYTKSRVTPGRTAAAQKARSQHNKHNSGPGSSAEGFVAGSRSAGRKANRPERYSPHFAKREHLILNLKSLCEEASDHIKDRRAMKSIGVRPGKGYSPNAPVKAPVKAPVAKKPKYVQKKFKFKESKKLLTSAIAEMCKNSKKTSKNKQK